MSVISVKTKYHVPPRQNSETGKGCIAYLSDENHIMRVTSLQFATCVNQATVVILNQLLGNDLKNKLAIQMQMWNCIQLFNLSIWKN